MPKRKPTRVAFIEDVRQIPANVTTDMASIFLNCKPYEVARRCKTGQIKAAIVARAWNIPKENLIAYSRGLPQPVEVGALALNDTAPTSTEQANPKNNANNF